MPISADPVSMISFESTVNALLYEFLNALFDGAQHSVGAFGNQSFPDCEINFHQIPLTQSNEKPEITITWLSSQRLRDHWGIGTGGDPDKVVEDQLSLMLWVRATGDTKRSDCVLVSDLLHAVFNNARVTMELAEKGMHGFRASTSRLVSGEGGGKNQSATGYDMRQLRLSFTVTAVRGLE